jgi:serine/threonine protein kinase
MLEFHARLLNIFERRVTSRRNDKAQPCWGIFMLAYSDIIISARYRLLQRLRQGGMSEVFLAFDEQTQQHVAIKLVTSDTPEYSKRLQREVNILRKLSHPHILPVLDGGIMDSFHYLVMPYMERGNLRERLIQGPLTLQEAGNMLAQLTNALQYAHDRGIVHRDIKPSNVLLDTDDADYVYLADFGLAREIEGGSDLTQTGCLIGTPQYMAPELADRPESVSSDTYALGIMLYQMLTGQMPFTGNDPLSIYWKQLHEEPTPPSSLNPQISPAIEQVILRALDKDPDQRFPDARTLSLAYTNAMKASEMQVLADQDMLMLPPVEVTLRKRATGTRAAFLADFWQNRTSNAQQKGLLSLAFLLLMILPLSLGFILSRDGISMNPALSNSSLPGSKVVPSILQAPPPHSISSGSMHGSVSTVNDALPQSTPPSGPTHGPTPPPKDPPGHHPGPPPPKGPPDHHPGPPPPKGPSGHKPGPPPPKGPPPGHKPGPPPPKGPPPGHKPGPHR